MSLSKQSTAPLWTTTFIQPRKNTNKILTPWQTNASQQKHIKHAQIYKAIRTWSTAKETVLINVVTDLSNGRETSRKVYDENAKGRKMAPTSNLSSFIVPKAAKISVCNTTQLQGIFSCHPPHMRQLIRCKCNWPFVLHPVHHWSHTRSTQNTSVLPPDLFPISQSTMYEPHPHKASFPHTLHLSTTSNSTHS